jgi:hypothetical protein
LKQGITALLGLIQQTRQHHQSSKHAREILLAIPAIVLEGITVISQGIEHCIFNFPQSPSFVLMSPRQAGDKWASALKCSLSPRQPAFNQGSLLKTASHFFQPRK